VRTLEERTFLLLTVFVTLAFAWVLWPFYGAILWGAVVAILFAPLNRRLLVAMPQRHNSAALLTITVVLLIVVLPLALISIAMVQEATALYEQIKSGEINFSLYFQQVADALACLGEELSGPFRAFQLRCRSGPDRRGADRRQPISGNPNCQYRPIDI
jgi:predicted PurR-regulated permease PerM